MTKMKVTYEAYLGITRVTGKNSSIAHNRSVGYCIMTVGGTRVQVPLSEFAFLKDAMDAIIAPRPVPTEEVDEPPMPVKVASKAQQVYDSVMASVPEVKVYHTKAGTMTDRRKYNEHTSRVSFEEQVWARCNGDKDLADAVMTIASEKLNAALDARAAAKREQLDV